MKFLSLLFLALSLPLFSHAKDCRAYLARTEDTAQASVTDNFISYLSVLLDNQVISINYLNVLIEDIDHGKTLSNPFSHLNTSSAQTAHEDNFEQYLASGQLDKNEVRSWAQKFLIDHGKLRKQKQQTQQQTQTPILKAIFHPIPQGEFSFKDPQRPATHPPIHIITGSPFELMETLVTKWMLAEVNKLVGKKDYDSIAETEVNHPAVTISLPRVKEFINDLNQLSLSQDNNIQTALKNIIIDHKPGDTYDLPTYQEMVLVMTNMGQYGDKYFDRNDSKELSQYAWYKVNSSALQPVAELNPRMINGSPFYDLEGNVHKWIGSDLADVLRLYYPSKKSFQIYDDNIAVIINGGFLHDDNCLTSFSFFSRNPKEARAKDTGFRLVRRKPSK